MKTANNKNNNDNKHILSTIFTEVDDKHMGIHMHSSTKHMNTYIPYGQSSDTWGRSSVY